MTLSDSNDLTDALHAITSARSFHFFTVTSFFIVSWFLFALISCVVESKMLKAWAANRLMQIESVKKYWLFTGPFFGLGPAYFITVIRNGRRLTGWVRFRHAALLDNRFVVHWTFPDPPNAP